MKRSCNGLLAASIVSLSFASCTPTAPDNRLTLTGAGSTFTAPLFNKWCEAYQSVEPTVLVRYDSVGSGEGQSRFVKGSVDFGVSESTLTSDQAGEVSRGALMAPLAASGIVLAYSPQDIADGLKLPRDVYVDIFLGKINSWDDPRIVAANPGVELPSRTIRPIVRQDGSGTTDAFTSHLSAISDEWRKGPGAGKLVSWPNDFVKENGNERLAGMIKLGSGSIGYVVYGAARAGGLHMARLENKRGEFITPSVKSAALSLKNVGYEADQLAALRDPDASGAYPIVTCTWLLVYKRYEDQAKANAMHHFVRWILTSGQKYGGALGYVPLASNVVADALRTVDQVEP